MCDHYTVSADASLWEILRARIDAVPFNLVASIIFLLAICHTFLTAKFRHWAHVAEEEHAVTGGGLTMIANAPNPAGQAILQRFFPNGVSPIGLLLGALAPTAVMSACFLLL